MKREVAEAIYQAAQEWGLPVELYEDYSGRCMFGTTTTGVVYESLGDLLRAVAKAAIDKTTLAVGEEPRVRPTDFYSAFRDLRTDQMGREMICY